MIRERNPDLNYTITDTPVTDGYTGKRGIYYAAWGIGISEHSKNKKEAVALLEFLSKAASQKMYGEINFEYPVNPNVETTEELKSWGSFKSDSLPIISIALKAYEAQKIIDKVGW